MCPHSGIVIGLKFKAHTDFIGLFFAEAAHLLMRLPQSAQQILHVVAYLVCNHISVGKIARGTYILLHIFEELQVYVHRLVGAAIEWTGLRGGVSAAALHGSAEQHQPRALIFAPALLAEFLGPDIFGSRQYFRGQVSQALILSVRSIITCVTYILIQELRAYLHKHITEITT